jgi:hypothetical protein
MHAHYGFNNLQAAQSLVPPVPTRAAPIDVPKSGPGRHRAVDFFRDFPFLQRLRDYGEASTSKVDKPIAMEDDRPTTLQTDTSAAHHLRQGTAIRSVEREIEHVESVQSRVSENSMLWDVESTEMTFSTFPGEYPTTFASGITTTSTPPTTDSQNTINMVHGSRPFTPWGRFTATHSSLRSRWVSFLLPFEIRHRNSPQFPAQSPTAFLPEAHQKVKFKLGKSPSSSAGLFRLGGDAGLTSELDSVMGK